MTSAGIVPLLRELYGRRPETRLGYSDELLDEGEIESAAQVARRDFAPDDEGAA